MFGLLRAFQLNKLLFQKRLRGLTIKPNAIGITILLVYLVKLIKSQSFLEEYLEMNLAKSLKSGSPLSVAILFIMGTASSFATPCGNVASPTACSLNINGNTLLTFSLFTIGNTSGSKQYQAGDVSIDLASGGGGLAVLTFTKNPSGPTAGSSFFVNSGENSGLLIQYNASLTPLLAGTVAFTSGQVSMQESHAGTGNGSLQFIGMSLATCLAFPPTDSTICTLNPALGTSFSGSDIMSINGNTSGNFAINTMVNTLGTSFTASPVPEPTTLGMVALGIALLAIRKKQ